MATHSSTLAWKIPWTKEPGRLQSMGSLRAGHNWETLLSLFTLMHWRRKWQPTPVFLPGESQGRGSLVGCRLWVAQSRTGLKRLSSSSSSSSSISGFVSQFWNWPPPFFFLSKCENMRWYFLMLNISYMDILLSKQVFLMSISQNYLYLGSLMAGYSWEFPGGPAAKTLHS